MNKSNFTNRSSEKIIYYYLFRMKHSGVSETHVCNVCGKNFTHKQYLDKHLLTHENTEKNFVCKVNLIFISYCAFLRVSILNNIKTVQ